jgi:surface antigen
MSHRTVLVAAAIGVSLLSAPVFGQGFNWLSNAPVRHFTDKDWEILRSTMRETLDNGANGSKVTWRNPDTGNHGTIEPLDTYVQNGLRCRRTAIANYAGGLSGQGVHSLCKAEDGDWKISS